MASARRKGRTCLAGRAAHSTEAVLRSGLACRRNRGDLRTLV